MTPNTQEVTSTVETNLVKLSLQETASDRTRIKNKPVFLTKSGKLVGGVITSCGSANIKVRVPQYTNNVIVKVADTQVYLYEGVVIVGEDTKEFLVDKKGVEKEVTE